MNYSVRQESKQDQGLVTIEILSEEETPGYVHVVHVTEEDSGEMRLTKSLTNMSGNKKTQIHLDEGKYKLYIYKYLVAEAEEYHAVSPEHSQYLYVDVEDAPDERPEAPRMDTKSLSEWAASQRLKELGERPRRRMSSTGRTTPPTLPPRPRREPSTDRTSSHRSPPRTSYETYSTVYNPAINVKPGTTGRITKMEIIPDKDGGDGNTYIYYAISDDKKTEFTFIGEPDDSTNWNEGETIKIVDIDDESMISEDTIMNTGYRYYGVDHVIHEYEGMAYGIPVNHYKKN